MSIDQQQPAQAPAEAKKSWFARHKVITGIGAFFLVVGIGSAAAGGGTDATAKQDGDSSSSSSSSTTTKTDNSKADGSSSNTAKTDSSEDDQAEVSEGLQSDGKTWIYGDWKISKVKISNSDSLLNMFKVSSDVTYMGEDTSGGDKCFNLTLDKGDRQVASGTGCASTVRPGKTTTLDFFTADDYVKGPYEITINKSW